MKNKFLKIVIGIAIIGIISFLIVTMYWPSISAQNTTEKIRPNDKFTVIMAPENPFEDTIKIKGKVLEKKGDWILYEDLVYGDTGSLNIYNHLKYFDVKIYGGK
jgi:hypothetical protein